MAMFKARTLLAQFSNLIPSRATAAEARHSTRPRLLVYQKSSKLVQLPEEMLLTIVDDLSSTDRAHLVQTCRYFRCLFEGILYHHLDTNEWRYGRTYRLHRTLSERLDLISFMTSYRGPLMVYSPPKPTELGAFERLKLRLQKKHVPSIRWANTPVTETETFRWAISIFTRAVNIQELEFTNCSDWASDPIWEPVKATISKMSLTRFSLPIVTESADVVSLLRGQPELEHLELSARVTGRFEDLQETDIPKLKSLKATLRNAAAIVPGRPVEEFRHMLEAGEGAPDEQLLRKLSLSTVPITKVTTGPWRYDSVQSSLQVLAHHLPEIQHLTLTVDGFISGQLLLAEIPLFRSLRSVKFLDAVLLEERYAAPPIYWVNDEGNVFVRQDTIINSWDALLERLKEKCPSLVDLKYTPRRRRLWGQSV
ncbi:hypothetical protein FS837_011186 [Tulasnella sp. UAMH 9824]|nr:hypothetical protein FS837_011186 [Tulasnella sp. UAMH 9824]